MLSTMLERRSLTNPSDSLWDAFRPSGGGRARSGVRVGTDNAMEWTALSAGVRRLASTEAMLPLNTYRRRSERGKDLERSHPAYRVLHDEANPEMTAFEYREMIVAHIPLFGVSYSEIVRDRRGRVVALWPLNPDRVRSKRTDAGELFYRITLPSRFGRGSRRAFVDLGKDKVLRIPGFSTSGLVGESLVKLHRESIGLGIATERFAAHFFGQGARPSGVLETDAELSDQAYERLRDEGDIVYGGLENAHRLAILEEGLSWKQITTDPEKAQMVEAQKINDRKAAQILNMQPHMIGDLSDATYSNIEQQSLEFVIYTLLPWLKRIEARMTMQLIEDDDVFCEHVVEGLLRGDSQARAEFYQARMQTGSITPNEIRELENDNPVEGGDTPFVPLNMIPLDQATELTPEQRASLLEAEAGEAPAPEEARAESRQTEDDPEPGAVEDRLRVVADFMPVFVEAAERMVRGEVRNVERLVSNLLSDGQTERFLEQLASYYREEHPDFAARVMRPAFEGLIGSVVRAATESVGGDELASSRVEGFVREYTERFTARYGASSRIEVERTVQGVRADEDAPDPDEAVRERLERWEEGTEETRPKAEQWADREAHQADNAAAKFAFAAAGVTLFRWATVGSSCPMCAALEGRVVEVTGSFVREGETVVGEDGETTIQPSMDLGHPPLHGGCDCRVVPGG